MEKLKKYWHEFLSFFSRIAPGDLVVFQIARDYSVHGFGIDWRAYYDDETAILSVESQYAQIRLTPRVEFSLVVISLEPLVKLEMPKEHYVPTYGLGLLGAHSAHLVLEKLAYAKKSIIRSQ
jgi:hypothetical protein